ncbi:MULTISPECIES: FecCD family ABC transporter permease [unclassified Brevundimonas]|uniref:FecCD family ABC transporter permease n=1 Tax=unclassified Brevundimonas TaxID=2622653 RepID=UPI0025BB2406|nr:MULTISPECIES: iron ABC transporter permease [unclassified Brevundimonas]
MIRSVWLNAGLLACILVAVAFGISFGETALTWQDYALALSNPLSGEGLVLWQIRLPRVLCALFVGAALGLSGAVMQGLLRNPLAEPGVIGVSGTAAFAAALAIVTGMAAIPGAVEASALLGAAVAGLLLTLVGARLKAPEGLILFGVALSSFSGAATALIFNLSPSPIASAEVMAWMLGSVANRSWFDVGWVAFALAVAAIFAVMARQGLRLLTLGEDVAKASGLPLARLRVCALLAAAVASGAAVAVAGVIGFVGLAAPHLVRSAVRGDPGRVLLPSALAGGLILVIADLATRVMPTDQELKLGVFTALIGAPLFAVIAWRAAREWRL